MPGLKHTNISIKIASSYRLNFKLFTPHEYCIYSKSTPFYTIIGDILRYFMRLLIPPNTA